jgi:hypothetical protein
MADITAILLGCQNPGKFQRKRWSSRNEAMQYNIMQCSCYRILQQSHNAGIEIEIEFVNIGTITIIITNLQSIHPISFPSFIP